MHLVAACAKLSSRVPDVNSADPGSTPTPTVKVLLSLSLFLSRSPPDEVLPRCVFMTLFTAVKIHQPRSKGAQSSRLSLLSR